MAENDDGAKPTLALTATRYFAENRDKGPKDSKAGGELTNGNNIGQSEPQPEATSPPVPAMLQRARKKSRRPSSGHLRRPFDGLRLWAWTLALPGLRQAIQTRYSDVLIEWRQGLNVLVGNEKGGSSKTSTAVLIWLLLAWLLDKTIILLDFNPAGGHARHRGGVGQTVNMRQFLFDEDFAAIASHRALSEQVGTHQVFRNAFLIDWNNKSGRHLKKRLTEEPTTEVIQHVLRGVTNISHSTVVDQGNPLTGSWYQSAVTYRPERSVAVVTFMLDQEFSEDGVSATIDAHIEAEPTCRDRIVLVVMNYRGGRKQRKEEIERLSYAHGIPKHRIVVIPHDPAFLNSDELDPETGKKLPRVLDPRQLRLRTLVAGMKLLVTIALTSDGYRALHNNPQLEGQ